MVRILFCIACLCGVFLGGCVESANEKNLEPKRITTQPPVENRLPGQYIVVLKEDRSQAMLSELFKPYGVKSIKALSKGQYLIILEKDPGPEEISNTAATSSEIESVQPNYIYRAM